MELLSANGGTCGSSEIGGLSSGTGTKSWIGSLERKGDGDTASCAELGREAEADGRTIDDGVISPEDLEDFMERLDPSVED